MTNVRETIFKEIEALNTELEAKEAKTLEINETIAELIDGLKRGKNIKTKFSAYAGMLSIDITGAHMWTNFITVIFSYGKGFSRSKGFSYSHGTGPWNDGVNEDTKLNETLELFEFTKELRDAESELMDLGSKLQNAEDEYENTRHTILKKERELDVLKNEEEFIKEGFKVGNADEVINTVLNGEGLFLYRAEDGGKRYPRRLYASKESGKTLFYLNHKRISKKDLNKFLSKKFYVKGK